MSGTRDDPPGGAPAPGRRRAAEEREARLAAALRANLRHRKAQARARSAEEARPGPAAPQPRGAEEEG